MDREFPGTFARSGDWRSDDQYIELEAFIAGEVNLVAQPGSSAEGAMTVLLDGKPIGDERGADVGPDAVARFDRAGMIRLAGASRDEHVLTVVVNDPGLQAYVFTFGPERRD